MFRLRNDIVISANVIEEWWVDGERHRDDGPAIIRNTLLKRNPNFNKNVLWIHGVSYSFNDWIIRSSFTDEEKVMMKLEHGQ